MSDKAKSYVPPCKDVKAKVKVVTKKAKSDEVEDTVTKSAEVEDTVTNYDCSDDEIIYISSQGSCT